MNSKFVIGLAAIAGTLCLLPAAANATDSVPPTTAAAVPTECTYTPEFSGPARATHSPERTAGVATPDCDTIDGICVILPLTGPSRTVHGITGTDLPDDPCDGVDDACVIVTDFPDRVGPSRAVHSRPAVEIILVESWPVEIPTACQDVLSAVALPTTAAPTTAAAAIPTTGSDSDSTLLLATGFLLAGAVLVFGVRRVAAR